MTDQIPADKVREIVEKMHDHANHDNVRGTEEEYVRFFAGQLDALLPAPPRLTLADLTMPGRRACNWMQCDVEGQDGEWMIIDPFDDEDHAHVVGRRRGNMRIFQAKHVTPRPDLPRMEWDGTEKAAPSPALPDGWRLADHKDHGRGIVTNPTPKRDGRVYYVIPAADPLGFDWLFCHPDELTYIDQGDDTSDAAPPNTLAVGSTWDDADALTRTCFGSGRDQIAMIDKNGDVGVWDAGLQSWCAYAASADFAPYTILHAGKKADQ